MKQSISETAHTSQIPKDEYDTNFEFNLTFSLTDYILMFMYRVILLPVELVNRIMSDCYVAYKERKAREESMRPLFTE